MIFTATYSPDDNKLRLTASSRLDAPLYARVKAHGFRWAPKQEQFICPRWTPAAEDLCIELAGEIEDDDGSLIERAEARAERFEGYSDSRAADAQRAHAAVSAIADNIPLGQPILIGHHSERHARRDAERIENGMRKAIRAFDTSKYWTERAAGAIRHAKYKERPDVRARRIKGIEADKRKIERTKAEAAKFLKTYNDPDAMTMKLRDGRELLPALLGTYEGGLSFEDQHRFERGEWPFSEALERAKRNLSATVSSCDRWLAHYDNRLAYERAMLADAGGTAADQVKPEKGGGCRCWASPRGGWSYIQKVNQISVTVLDNWGNSSDKDGTRNFTRTIPFDKLGALMTRAQIDEKRAAGLLFDTDDKTGYVLRDTPAPEHKPAAEPQPNSADFEAMRDTLKQGIAVVSVAQLFPTPPELAARMVELAEIEPGHRVLEPSAGTGNLLAAMPGDTCRIAVEINEKLAKSTKLQQLAEVICADFLHCNGILGTFDRIVMNPPFADGADIEHVKHALKFLKPGGRLIALCANGPRQQRELYPLGDWIVLPAGSFKMQGTMVNAAMLVIDKTAHHHG